MSYRIESIRRSGDPFRARFSIAEGGRRRILERPRPGQTGVLQDEDGDCSLLHLAGTEDDAARWLDAHPHRNARIVPADAPEARLFTYLQDPGHAG